MKPYIPLVAPKLLHFMGYFSPLGPGGIGNITLAPFIISEDPMDEGDETHEGIHVLQQYECGVVGGILAVPLALLLGAPWWAALLVALAGFTPGVGWFYWVYYATYAYWALTAKKKQLDDLDNMTPGQKGYYLIPFEREAYLYDGDGFDYFAKRKLFAWVRIRDDELERAGAERSERLFTAYENDHVFGTLFSRKRSS